MLQKASAHEDAEIQRLYGLASSHLDALKEMDAKYDEAEFHSTVREVCHFSSSVFSARSFLGMEGIGDMSDSFSSEFGVEANQQKFCPVGVKAGF